jgi:signal transduction histidine kinase
MTSLIAREFSEFGSRSLVNGALPDDLAQFCQMSQDLSRLSEGGRDFLLRLLDYVRANRKSERHLVVLLSHAGMLLARATNEKKLEFRFKFLLARASVIINYHLEALTIPILQEILDPIDSGFIDKHETVLARLALAKAYRNVGELNKALDHYRASLEHQARLGDELSIFNHRLLIAKLFGNYYRQPTRALEQLRTIAGQINAMPHTLEGERILAICYDEIGNIYRKSVDDPDHAEKYYRNAIDLNRKHEAQAGLGRCLSHLGLLYWRRGSLSDAHSLLTQGLAVTTNAEGQERGMGIRLGQLGALKSKLGSMEEGLSLIERGLAVNRYYNDRAGEIKNLIYMADLYATDAKQSRGDLITARGLLERSCEIAERNKLTNLEAEASIKLGDLLREEFTQFEDAHRLYQKAFALSAADWKRIFAVPPEPGARSDPQEMERILQEQFARYQNDVKELMTRLTETIASIMRPLINQAVLDKEHEVLIGAVHRLRTPLMGLRGTLQEMLSVSESRDDMPRNLIEDADSSLRKIETGVGSFLEAGMARGRQRQATAPHQIINSIIQDVRADFEEVSVDLRTSEELAGAIVVCDVAALDTSVREITLNACAAARSADPIVKIQWQLSNSVGGQSSQNTSLCVKISDNGSGIPEHIAQHIFEPGFTTKGPGRGVGLGISRSMIERAGGKIEVARAEGWTTFEICVPVGRG